MLRTMGKNLSTIDRLIIEIELFLMFSKYNVIFSYF